jgi:hypothetical protein
MATTITANGINFPDGSAGSPSIGGSDTNTGLFTGSDIVGFATGGSERLKIDASGNINIANDSGKLQLGASNDLQIYHDGSHSYIKDTGTGNLVLATSELSVNNAASDEEMIKATQNGGVELFYDNSKKFETTSAGVTVSGNIDIGGADFNIADSGQIHLGDNADLRIYHDGSNSYIKDSGYGLLIIESNQLQIKNDAADEKMIVADANGAVQLFYDNSKKFETTSSGLKVTAANSSGQAYELYNTDSSATVWKVNGEGDGFFRNTYPITDSNLDLGYHASNKWRDLVLSGGVRFGNNTAANYLDDYEEGTFTPTNTIGLTLTNNTTAHYTKIGRVVHIQIDCTFSGAADSSQCGIIQNLPFTSKSGCVNEGSLQFISNTSNGKFDYDEENTRIFIGASESRIDIQNITSGTFQTRAFMVGRRFRIQMHYLTA